MPPPRALPLAPLASTVFPLTVLLRSVVGPKVLMPPPLTSTEPRGAEAWMWLSLLSVPPISPAPERPTALPVEPGRVVAVTLLLLITSLLRVVGARSPASLRPPATTPASKGPEFVAVAALPEIVLLLIVTACGMPLRWTPPTGTKAKKSLVTVALLLVTELLLMVNVLSNTPSSLLKAIPPASAITPWGDTAA